MKTKRKNLLMLYTEAMPYTKALLDELYHTHHIDTTLVYKDKNKRTPYVIEATHINTIKRSETNESSLCQLVDSLMPNVIYVSGTMDKTYLAVAKYAKRKGIKVIMGSDKKWKGTLKDYGAMLLSPFLYRPYFTHGWSPGPLQYKYLKNVGFNKILKSLLTAETKVFQKREIDFETTNDILFIGRLVESKGLNELVEACKNLRAKNSFRGKLIIYGNGPLKVFLEGFDWIDVRGFANQETMVNDINTISIFCLPSWDEPYGLVIHEMAAAGFPIVCSKNCGASFNFVEEGKNGYLATSKSVIELETALEKLLKLSSNELTEMGNYSRLLSNKISPKTSAQELVSIF